MSLQTMIRERGLKQSWVASEIGVTESHFSEMVRGIKSVPIKKVELLAKVLQVDIATIVVAVTHNKEPT